MQRHTKEHTPRFIPPLAAPALLEGAACAALAALAMTLNALPAAWR